MTGVLLKIVDRLASLFGPGSAWRCPPACCWLCCWLSCWLCCFAAVTLGGGAALAAPPENWEVMRVFVRDQPDQISRLVTRHYATVLLDDLARELSEHDSLRKLATLQAPALQESLYVARLEGEQIVSDQSRWTVEGNTQTQPLELGRISLALRTPRGLDASRALLLDRVQFTAAGGVELRPSTTNTTYWFGFLASAQSSSGSAATQRRFRFQVPPAPTAKLLIATADNIELQSNSVVVQKLAGLREELPEDWPDNAAAPAGGASQWWLVHLSGVSEFELLAKQQSGARLSDYTHLVRSAQIDYVGSESELQAHARFLLVGSATASALRVRLASNLKVESINVDGLPVDWQAQSSSDSVSNLVELLQVPVSTQDRTIVIKASCALRLTGEVPLP